MPTFAYDLIDVFTETPLAGNPLAVFHDARGIAEPRMQQVAREMNLSETTFVFPPADKAHAARVRIFTPIHEMPMAGHPTLGTAYTLATRAPARPTQLVLEEGVGPIPVQIEWDEHGPTLLTMDQPRPTFGPLVEDRAGVAQGVSLEPADLHTDLVPEIVSCGVPYLMVPVRKLEAVRRARPRFELLEKIAPGVDFAVFVFCFETETPQADVHARMFATSVGEDPATGSANGPLGAFLMKTTALGDRGRVLSFVTEQGLEMGRPSQIFVDIEGTPDSVDRVRVGGKCVQIGQGTLEVPS